MKYIDANLLREELQKLKNELKVGNYYLDNSEQAVGYENALVDFELLIDSLQQELPSLPSELDEAAEKYANREYPNEPSCGQWGTGDYEPPVDMEYPREIAKDSFKAGAEWQKAKMLDDAIEGRVGQSGFHNSIYIKEPEWCDTLDKFNNGDKVRVIIIKEDK